MSTECRRATRSRSCARSRHAPLASSAANQRRRSARLSGESRSKKQRIAVEEVVEHRIGREHRQARRRSLVDDLVGRPGLHVVDEQVAAREQRREPRARGTASPSGSTEALELARDDAARARSAPTPWSATSTPSTCSHGAEDRLDPFGRRVAAEHERLEVRPCASRSVQPNSFTSIPCPIGRTLREAQRERAAVDADDRGRELLGRTQLRGRLPVRVPEQQRRSARAHERRGEHDVGGNHVRDDRVRRQRMRELALEPPAGARESVHRTSAPRRLPAARHRRPTARARPARRRARRAHGASGSSPRAPDARGRRSASGRPAAASEEVRVAEREPPGTRIEVELGPPAACP